MSDAAPASQRVYLHAITYLARDTHAFEFHSTRASGLAPFAAGAHVDLRLPNGVRRSYSLCNPQGETHRYVIGVKKAAPSRGASVYLHERLRVGEEIEVGLPRNNFALFEAAPHSVLIAGGIGITPVWCMVQRLLTLGASWELHYASRTPRDAAFLAELNALASDPLRLRMTFDHEPGGRMLDLPAIISAAPPYSHFYACGPAPMLDAFEQAAAPLPRERIHLERFTGASESVREGGAGFDILLARSNRQFHIPAGKSILDVLLDEGVDIAFSCMDGVCGSCKVGVLDGLPDHHDSVLGPDEHAANTAMMVCCSGSLTERLVLDL
jgi:vanillate O-demethylase ferredoxin subunit